MNPGIAKKVTSRRLAAALLLAFNLLSLAAGIASAEQVCTTQRVGREEFRGISGTADDNVIAVGKKGTIYRFDGTSWNAMTTPTREDLNDVEVVGDTAFAVGKDGEVLQLVGGAWISLGPVGDEDLYGVWAASASEAYVVGKNGTLFVYDGASWSDQSAAAGTIPDDLTDVWGDAGGVYVISEKGDLYRFDRASGTWLPRDTQCTVGDKFEDLWGDGSGNLYLVGKKDVFLYDGAGCTVIASAGEDLFGVYGWSQDGDVHAVGKKGTVFEFDDGAWTETQVGNKELQDNWVSPAGNAYYAGKNKELTVCECVDCPVQGLPQFLITHDSYGIHCLGEVIQVQVIDSLSGTPRNDYNAEVIVDTQSGSGDWSLVAGGGTLTDLSPGDGVVRYDWPLGESAVTLVLDYPEGSPSIDVDVYQASDPGIRDTDAEGLLEFSPSGFSVTATPLPNPPGVVVPFSAAQVAGTDFAIYLAAYGQTPSDPQCGIIESYSGPKSLKFWSDYVDPVAGTIAISIEGGAIAATEAGAAVTPVTFVNGQAAVAGKYKDVGRIQVSVKDDSLAHPDLPNGIRGATAGFVVRPFGFALTNIENSGGTPNPGATDASGAVFIAAGEPFSTTVTALDAEGSVTPNYGQETVPETVALAPTLVAPPGGNNPALGNPQGFGGFVNGTATGTSFTWPEVGIIQLVPAVGDGDYLGAGNVSGAASGNVGRFRPHHFTTMLNVPTFATQCAAGSFSYIGETFGYSNAPVVTLTARATAGQVTENYADGFFKLDNASLPDPVYTAVPATLDTSGLPPGTSDPVVAELGAGLGSLTFSSGSGLRFVRGTEEPPFDADIQLSIDVVDADGVAALDNPVRFGDPGGMLFDGGATMRYGRARLLNAYGSELVNLALPLQTEYFVDTTTGFVQNSDDACTSSVTLSLGAFTDNLAPGETCIFDSAAPGSSGAGCAAAGPIALRFREPPLGGDFNLHLRAPGDGNDGSTTATADVPSWLEYDWNSAAPGDEDPSGTAVFGVYKGQDRRIYIREVY